jgi:hypothetical protein
MRLESSNVYEEVVLGKKEEEDELHSTKNL